MSPAAANSTARLNASEVQPACASRPWTEMIAGFRRTSGIVSLGITGSGSVGSPKWGLDRGSASAIPTAAPTSNSERITAGTQDEASRSSSTGILTDETAAAIARATPIVSAAARRIVLLPIGKDRAPRLAQRRGAKNHQLNGYGPSHSHTRTTDCYGPRLEARQRCCLNRTIGDRLRLNRIESNNLAIAAPVGRHVD